MSKQDAAWQAGSIRNVREFLVCSGLVLVAMVVGVMGGIPSKTRLKSAKWMIILIKFQLINFVYTTSIWHAEGRHLADGLMVCMECVCEERG